MADDFDTACVCLAELKEIMDDIKKIIPGERESE